MTEKVAKKVGEAYAFGQILADTFADNTDVMTKIFGDRASDINATTELQRTSLQKRAKHYDKDSVVLTKATKTATKITTMGEMYVGDDWDDPAEVLEWMSFFVGGAIVHWQLLIGSAQAMGDEEFLHIVHTGVEYYTDLLEQLKSYAITIGTQRAE